MSTVEDVKFAAEAFLKDEFLASGGESVFLDNALIIRPTTETDSPTSASDTTASSHANWASGQYAAR